MLSSDLWQIRNAVQQAKDESTEYPCRKKMYLDLYLTPYIK